MRISDLWFVVYSDASACRPLCQADALPSDSALDTAMNLSVPKRISHRLVWIGLFGLALLCGFLAGRGLALIL
jgi:hypothetical protein